MTLIQSCFPQFSSSFPLLLSNFLQMNRNLLSKLTLTQDLKFNPDITQKTRLKLTSMTTTTTDLKSTSELSCILCFDK